MSARLCTSVGWVTKMSYIYWTIVSFITYGVMDETFCELLSFVFYVRVISITVNVPDFISLCLSLDGFFIFLIKKYRHVDSMISN